MQILGNRSKVLLIVVAVVMLVAVGVSFAAWDNMSVVRATTGNVAYATAQVGDIIQYGKYYQTGNKVSDEKDAEYEKTPIDWIVVDKDERTGQLTLMSKYILACGSYFGNRYSNEIGDEDYHYKSDYEEIGKVSYNQVYAESTARAFLNNLMRRDLGGDSYSTVDGYKTSANPSATNGKLLTSVGFSNKRHTFANEYIRPIFSSEYRNRPATRGFYDEAFTDEQKSMILPKVIPGYIGHRWPNISHAPTTMVYVEGAVDKVWLPSATELNIMAVEDDYTNPSDESSSTVFAYFKGKSGTELRNALEAKMTPFVTKDSKAMNYSIPVYQYQSTSINDDISLTENSRDYYWTRSPRSNYYGNMRVVYEGAFTHGVTSISYIGVRPCVILNY